MDCDTACKIINEELVFAPGWEFLAQNATHLHGSTVHVQVSYPAVETGRDDAVKGYPEPVKGQGGFFLIVADDATPEDILTDVFRKIIQRINDHEGREMLRLKPDYRAPLHPHTVEGRKRWNHGAEVCNDSTFGYPVVMPDGPAREILGQ